MEEEQGVRRSPRLAKRARAVDQVGRPVSTVCMWCRVRGFHMSVVLCKQQGACGVGRQCCCEALSVCSAVAHLSGSVPFLFGAHEYCPSCHQTGHTNLLINPNPKTDTKHAIHTV